nr:reverse transcriptase domain-containing protein [Tanacetum cinerariifolium]
MDFENYVKANDAIMRNMQNQGQNVQNQLANLTDMLSKFMSSNTASSSGSGGLPSNTVTNPKEDLKGITTRSGVAYQGPTTAPSKQGTKPEEPVSTSEQANTLVSASKPNPQALIPYPSRRNDERNWEKAKDQIEKFYQIFKDMSFEISFSDALILMPKFASTLKALIDNKEKLSEMARTSLNEHYSAVLLKKLPEKLGDPGKFLIPCDFSGMAECLALADLGASINLMPYYVWKKLSLPDPTPTCMTLELADRSISRPVGVAEDVYIKVGSFHFPVDFVVVDFDADPRVPLILGRSFLKTRKALIDIFEEYSQKVLGFSDTAPSRNPTPLSDPIVSTTSLTLTPFGESDFLLEEVDAFLAVEDESISSLPQSYLNPKGDTILLESFLNDDPSLPPPNQRNSLPKVSKELKICEAKTKKSSVDKPPVIELKALPPHLEYDFLEGNNKLPIIIAKDLSVEEKAALITVLKSYKRAIAWKLSDIKGGFMIVENEENELIPTRLVMGWRVCIDYRKLNEATKKDHFPLPFMDHMLERLAGNQYYCFLDGFLVTFKFPSIPRIKKRPLSPVHTGRSLIAACLLGYATLLERFKGESTFKVIDTKGAENLAADHLSRLENPHKNVLDPKEINESFPLETLNLVSTRGNQSTLWFADFANYHAWNFIVNDMSSQQKKPQYPVVSEEDEKMTDYHDDQSEMT